MRQENRKILLLCHAGIAYCKICSSHISPTKHRSCLLKISLIKEARTEERALGCTSNHRTATVLWLQLCCLQCHTYAMTLGERKNFPLHQAQEELILQCNDPALWVQTRLNWPPYQKSSQMALLVVSAHSYWLNTPFTPEAGSTDMAGQCIVNTARVCSVGTMRRDWAILSNCSPHLSTSGQNIKKHLHDFSVLILLYLL